VDYIFFIIVKNASLTPNVNEVRDTKYVTMEEAKEIVEGSKQGKYLITPWFRLIFREFLFPWWEQLKSSPSSLVSDDKIHRLE
jgi:isopentenyl-diphosphate delta-isomerase